MERISTTEPGRTRRRGLRGRHVAAATLTLAVTGLLGYAFWPVLTGAGEEDGRPDVARAAVPPVTVEAVVAQPVDFALRAEATGTLAPWRLSLLGAEASGRVMRRLVKEGDYVEAGALLLQLDDREARLRLEEAEASLLQARGEYAVRQTRDDGVLPLDTMRLAEARKVWTAAQTARAEGAISDEELETARRRYEAALLLGGSMREAMRRVVTGLAEAEQRVAQARLQLSRTRVTAPFAGRVADLKVEVGQHVSPGQALLTLLDDRRMKVEVDVLESDLVHLRRGATALVRLPSLADTVVAGTIHTINPRVDTKTGAGRVTVAVRNPSGRLLTGLFAYVALETRRLPERLVTPAEAVLVRQGRSLVFVVRNGRAQWQYVTLGPQSGDYVALEDGVAAGDTVAVAGHHALAHDAPVRVTAVRPAYAEERLRH